MTGAVNKTTVPEYTKVLLPKFVKLTIMSLREEDHKWPLRMGAANACRQEAGKLPAGDLAKAV
jgi:hypothetical protein